MDDDWGESVLRAKLDQLRLEHDKTERKAEAIKRAVNANSRIFNPIIDQIEQHEAVIGKKSNFVEQLKGQIREMIEGPLEKIKESVAWEQKGEPLTAKIINKLQKTSEEAEWAISRLKFIDSQLGAGMIDRPDLDQRAQNDAHQGSGIVKTVYDIF
jgi:hypothetical protein